MKCKRIHLFSLALAIVTVAFCPTLWGQAHTLRVLHTFTNKWDGGSPFGGLLFDSAGNIYGTANGGGNPNGCVPFGGCGVVFKLSQNTSGAWQETPLFHFSGSATGAGPLGDLVMDASGNLFGADLSGGGGGCSGAAPGCGLIYELSPTSTGSWPENILHVFTNGPDGAVPFDGLTPDGAGNYFGTTANAGNLGGCGGIGCGVVFELSPNGSGGWTQTVIYTFGGASDGGNPAARVIFDGAGNLYGVAYYGGDLSGCFSMGCGVVYELSPSSSGAWTQTVLHTFRVTGDGINPFGALTFDSAGNLYGVTYGGGISTSCGGFGCGIVFKLTPNVGGWSEKILHAFTGGSDGAYAQPSVTVDASGNVYGVTLYGGDTTKCSGLGCGVLFKLSQNTSGMWHESVLHTFTGGSDGSVPSAPLAFGPDGNIYGTAQQGAAFNAGTVFRITP